MLSFDIDQVIITLCDQFGLHDHHSKFEYDHENELYRDEAGLLLMFHSEACSFGSSHIFTSRRDLIGVVVAGHRVWIKRVPAEVEDRTKLLKPDDSWENISNHDSCWRSAIRDACTKIYFDQCEQVNVEREKKEYHRVAPRDITIHIYTMWSPLFQQAVVEWKKSNREYFLDLVNVEITPLKRTEQWKV